MSFLNSVSNFANQAAATAQSVGTGIEKAASKAVDGVTKELAEAEDAFKNGTLVEGAAELLDATSTGTAVSGALSAVGLLPEDGPGKEIVSALVNLATPIPTAPLAAMKDLADAFSHMPARTGPAQGGQVECAPAHTPVPPKRRLEDIELGHCMRPHGWIQVTIGAGFGFNRALRPGMDVALFIKFGPMSPLLGMPMKMLMDGFEKLIMSLLKGSQGPGCVKPKPIEDMKNPDDASFEDILKDPRLSFEDKLFLFMCKFVQDQEDKIAAQMEKMEAAKSSSQDAANGHPPFQDLLKKIPSISGGLGATNGGKGTGKFKLPLKEAGSMIQAASVLAPVIAPLLGSACAAIPYVGPFLSAAMPVLLPVAMNLVGGALQGADGVVNGALDQMQEEPKKSRRQTQRRPRGRTRGRPGQGHWYTTMPVPPHGKPAEGDGKKNKSEALMMEELKKMTQDLTKMQQALSNVLNNMHNSAMNSIRNIK